MLLTSTTYGQGTSGTDFWVAFLQNIDKDLDYEYYLRIFVSAQEATEVTIENEKVGYKKTLSLGDNSIEKVIVPFEDFNVSEYGEVVNKSLHIVSEKNISVYAENYQESTCDASLILPTKSCGSYYIIQNNVSRSISSKYAFMPSTFSVVAMEDDTEVEITPTLTTTDDKPANEPFKVTLNKGDVYQVANKEEDMGKGLSGSQVHALNGKKVTVFSGNRCTNVPDECTEGDSDILYDISYPVSSWGKNFVIIPFKGCNNDMIKCTACKNGTKIYKNGELLTTINALESYEFIVAEADGVFKLETSEPVCTYQYMTSSLYLTERNGGPSYQYVAPIEQAIDEITFTTIAHNKIYSHYLNIVIKTEDVESATLNGETGFATFKAVDDTYSTASVKIDDGIYTLKAKNGFIANIYGTGQWISYSYSAGSEIKNINNTKPLGCTGDECPDNVFDPTCTAPVESNEFDMEQKFTINGVNSMTNVVVGDIDGDGIPEILACGQSDRSPYYSQNILVIDGKEQKLKFTIETPSYYTYGLGLAIADVDKDKKAEIFLLCNDHIIRCYDNSGKLKWSTNEIDYFYQLSVADINADGTPELICGRYIYNAQTGALLLAIDYEEEGTGFTSPHSFHNSSASNLPRGMNAAFHMFALHDFTNNDTLEMAAGNTLYKINITNNTSTEGNSFDILYKINKTSTIPYMDGGCIVADFDNDGDADIIVIASQKQASYNSQKTSNVYVWDGQTDELIAYHTLTQSERTPSVPFCGDINNDGKVEVCFCTMKGFNSLQYDEEGEEHIKMIHKDYAPFHETSGFTAFDFNQDGRDEFVYHDMENMYIVDGESLEAKSEPVTAYSGTIMEFPVVADIDGDGHAEIIITQSHYDWVTIGNSDGYVAVYGSKKPGAWSSARKVWNQFHYNAVNINEDLTVPTKLFDVSTQFNNGKRPFNTFHKQLPYINKDGDLFNITSDLKIVDEDKLTITSFGDSILFEGITIANGGERSSVSPLCLRINLAEDTTKIILDTCIKTNLGVGEKLQLTLKALDPNINGKARITVNPYGENRQPECDYTNNTTIKALSKTNRTYIHDTICVESVVTAEDTIVETQTNNGEVSEVITYRHYRQSYNITTDMYICEGETYMGHTTSGDYTWEGKTQAGCDSIVHVKLTILPNVTTNLSATIKEGESYEFGGIKYTTTGTYTWRGQTWSGCDSIVKLNLTVLKANEESISATICEGQIYRLGEDEYNATGEYVWTGKSQNGGDSIVTLNLKVAPIVTENITDRILLGYEYDANGFSLPEQTMTGVFNHQMILTSQYGCDSIVNLSLTVIAPEVQPEEVLIPTVFTPHHREGKNDIFMAGYEVYIYDRYGNMVCHSTNGWDGYYRGEVADPGVYIYTLFLKDGQIKKGSIEIYK